ncbi:MAG: hypothetical protein JXB40_03435 [Candidatus Omnitrophica bacterium]|nr:hypothetical protein [Candidatus Omnitrophota bacterium]
MIIIEGDKLMVLADIEKPQWAPDVSGGLAFETKYIWRGQDMVDGPVLQPEAALSKYGITLSYWGNVRMDGSVSRWTEHDYAVDYTAYIGKLLDMPALDKLGASTGNIFYIFPENSGKEFHSEEFYFGFSYDCLLRPWFKCYVDYARGAGSYLQFGIGHTFNMPGGIGAKLATTLAYNAGQWGYGYKAAPILFSGEICIPVLKYFTVAPNIYYSLALDRTDDDAAYGSEFFGGVKISAAY